MPAGPVHSTLVVTAWLVVVTVAFSTIAAEAIAAGTAIQRHPRTKSTYGSQEDIHYKFLLEHGYFEDALETRAWDLEPQRRDDPLRYENISDEEVREVQAAAAEILPRDYVSINGVVVGCPCEDGLKCTNQVWVVARRAGVALGLQISKIDGHWVIGPVQRWYLRYQEMRRRHARSSTEEQRLKDNKEAREMLDQIPACETPPPAPGQVPAPRTSH
jgi:hypothetical protein